MRALAVVKFLYFKATEDLRTRSKSYGSRKQQAKRDVFREYRSKNDTSKVLYYRHVGFEPRFRRFDGHWCLEINPTYLFTSDGHQIHPYHQEYLAKIKSIEGSGAVGNLVVMFASLLRDKEGLFAGRDNYPYLGFGNLLGIEIDVGINDESWSKPRGDNQVPLERVDSEDADAVVAGVADESSTLFDDREDTDARILH